MRRLLVICNAAAGSADDAARTAALAVLREHADVVDVAVDAPEKIDKLLARHPDRDPVAVGGDGTMHLLMAAMYRSGDLARRTVGLIPLGTGNDLARTLGLPQEPDEAARVVLTGRRRWLDLLVDDTGGIAVNAVHLGIGADASATATRLKPWLRRLAYLVAAVVTGLRPRGWRLRVEVDGRTVADGHRRVLMVAIGNGSTIGGGTPLAPDADPGDTRADVVVSFATGRWQRLVYGLLLRLGRHPEHRDVVTSHAREVRITGQPALANADGEVRGPVSQVTWRVLPHSWRITVPDEPPPPSTGR